MLYRLDEGWPDQAMAFARKDESICILCASK